MKREVFVPDCGSGKTGTLPLGNIIKSLLNLNLSLSPSHFKLLAVGDHHTGKGVIILTGIIDPHYQEEVGFCTM